MSTTHPAPHPLSPDIQTLLDHERVISPQPAEMRARALERARTSLAHIVPPMPTPPRLLRTQPFVAAGLALVMVGAAGTALYELVMRGSHKGPSPATLVIPGPVAETARMKPVPAANAQDETADNSLKPAATAATAPMPGRERAARPRPLARTASDEGDFGIERKLLQQARDSLVEGQFADALVPIAEHDRRFSTGRLVEEREALRVRALSGLGRTEDAHRAASEFRTRFPRSVLLPRMSEPVQAAPR